MASKNELEADNVELRKKVERAVRELDRFGSELAEIVAGRNDVEARTLRIVARRACLVAGELGEELREELDVETVSVFIRVMRNEYTRKAIGGLIAGLAAKYGPEIIDHADLALDAVDDVLAVLGGLGGEPATGSPDPAGTASMTESDDEGAGNLLKDDGGRLLTDDGRPIRLEDGNAADSLSATAKPRTIEPTTDLPTVVTGHGTNVRATSGTADLTLDDSASARSGVVSEPLTAESLGRALNRERGNPEETRVENENLA